MNDINVIDFIDESFDQDGNDSAILKIRYCNPTNLILHYLTVKEKVKT